MNIEAYISSGKLEQYLLGLLSESEAQEVEQVAAAYPEVKAELNAMEDALSQYALARGIPMPAELPERIVLRWETLDKKSPAAPPAAPPKTDSGGSPVLPILAVLLLAALGGLLYFWFQNSDLEDNLNQAQANLQQLQDDCDNVRDTLNQTTLQLAILRSEGNETYIMRGLEDKNPGAVANVYYNNQTQNTYLDIRELPAPPQGQQYQLWGIGANGVQSLGVFDIPSGSGPVFLPVPYLPEIDVFAVSLEPAGGSPTPTEVHLMSPTG